MRISKPAILSIGLILLAISTALYSFCGVKVRAAVQGDYIPCPAEYPIHVTVHNYTFKRLIRVNLQLEGWKDGISDNILKNDFYTFNRVLEPFSSGTGCFGDPAFAFPKNPNTGLDVGGWVYDYNQQIKVTKGVEMVVDKVSPEFY